jgi:hypothetical protein
MSSDLLFSAAIPAIAFLLAGMSRGGMAGGVGLLSVPILSLVMPPWQAAAALLPLLGVLNVATLLLHYRSLDRRMVFRLIPASAVGVAAGWGAAKLFNGAMLSLFIGLILVLVSLLRIANDKALAARKRKETAANHLATLGWGIAAGFASFVAHAGGGPLVIALSHEKNRGSLIGATCAVFALVDLLKAVAYAQLGWFTADTLRNSVVMAPIALLGFFAARRFTMTGSDRAFRLGSLGLVTAAGVTMMALSLSESWH